MPAHLGFLCNRPLFHDALLYDTILCKTCISNCSGHDVTQQTTVILKWPEAQQNIGFSSFSSFRQTPSFLSIFTKGYSCVRSWSSDLHKQHGALNANHPSKTLFSIRKLVPFGTIDFISIYKLQPAIFAYQVWCMHLLLSKQKLHCPYCYMYRLAEDRNYVSLKSTVQLNTTNRHIKG